MLEITEKQLEIFRQIKKAYIDKSKFPEKGNWEHLSNNDIWLHIFTQVMVVGRSTPYQKLSTNPMLKNEISYENLSRVMDQTDLEKKINHVLLAVGTRYASSDISKCLKTKALVYNFKALHSAYGDPQSFLKKIMELGDDQQRISFVIKSFMFIKNKGARDLLMELGIVEDSIAIDVRVQNVLKRFGIEVPQGFQNNPKLYGEIESGIIEKICKPLGLRGVELDRLIYQNYDAIMKQ
ncbi:MAG: hypothetical protein ABSB71_08535 [Candidatus Bathyarchaeia archaeon]|jgi:thermostable 8-oxoguanine DNA glycosylase